MREQIIEYKIENKPLDERFFRQRSLKYPFKDMKVGQSFFVPNPDAKKLAAIRSSAYLYARRNNMKFAFVRDGAGYRCGRIK